MGEITASDVLGFVFGWFIGIGLAMLAAHLLDRFRRRGR